jgi:hypothetical protein
MLIASPHNHQKTPKLKRVTGFFFIGICPGPRIRGGDVAAGGEANRRNRISAKAITTQRAVPARTEFAGHRIDRPGVFGVK